MRIISISLLFFICITVAAQLSRADEPAIKSDTKPVALKSVPSAELIKTIAFDGFMASEIYPADIDGDGRLDLLCLQSPGIYQSEVYAGTKLTINEEERLAFCLTAISQEGKILWQHGKPSMKVRQPARHVADQMLCFGLISDKTKPEIALINMNTLSILDAATGKVKRSTELRYDNYTIVQLIKNRKGNRLLVQNTDMGYEPYKYGCPAAIYDAKDLRLLKVITEPQLAGHSPRAVDLNGDGDDEILIGVDAYDADGALLWRVNGLGPVDPRKNHVDQLQVGKFGSPPAPGVIYASSFDVVIASAEGKLLSRQPFGHPQHVVIGDFRTGDKKACAAVYCCYDRLGSAQEKYLKDAKLPTPPKGNRSNIAFLNPQGNIVQLLFPPGLEHHSGEGILIYPQGAADGSDAIVTRDWVWPEVFDMSGERPFAFTRPEVKPPPNDNYPSGPGTDDGYGVRIANFAGDDRAEILIHDQTTAWIYSPPFPKEHAPHTHAKLKPVTGQGNYGWSK